MLKKFQPPPTTKPPGMSEEAWKIHLEEVKAFERRNYRQSAGQRAAQHSQASQPKNK
jgi:hypothetical protein